MRKVLVSFEVSVSQSNEHPLIIATPDLVFSGEFDKDDNKSFTAMCLLEYKVEELAKNLKSLGCQFAVIRKEVSHLNID